MSDRNPYYEKPEGVRNNSPVHRIRRIAYATIVFAASYIAAVYIDRLAVYLSAVSFGYEPTLLFWTISDLPMKYIEWSKQRVMLIFTIGSITLFITAMLLLLLYKKISRNLPALRLFGLWLAFNCLALVGANIGTSIFGLEDYSSIYFMNFSVVLVWWGIPSFTIYIMMFIYAILLFVAGYFFANMLLRMSHSQRLVKKYYGRLQVLLQFYALPLIIGSLLLTPFSLNNILFLGFHVIALTLLLIGMIARINDFYELHGVYRVDILETQPWLLALLALLFALPVLNS